MYEIYHGKHVVKCKNDVKNGPDRIVNGVEIQTKYRVTANKSVNSAFANGQYRYLCMKLEVPKDQYDEAVRLVRGRIINGKASGITDSNMAEHMVVKEHYTYDEAVVSPKLGCEVFRR